MAEHPGESLRQVLQGTLYLHVLTSTYDDPIDESRSPPGYID